MAAIVADSTMEPSSPVTTVTNLSHSRANFNDIPETHTSHRLSQQQSAHLNTLMKRATTPDFAAEDDEDNCHASHGGGKTSIFTALASGAINYMLMFGLCCAYGMVLFNVPGGAKHQALGVKLNISTAALVGFTLSCFSKVPVAIGGPDLNPVVFLSVIVIGISETLVDELELSTDASSAGASAGRRRKDGRRQLGAASSGDADFCVGDHLELHRADCEDYDEQLLATTIFAVAVSSLLLGTIFFLLGRFRLSKAVSYLPSAVTEAFLSCIGYKVFYYAIKFSNYDPLQFIPAMCIGVPLYFMKAMHIGNPAVVIPTMLLVPLGIFYIGLYASGSDIASARKCPDPCLYFPEMGEVEFWKIWTSSAFKLDKINFGALTSSIPNLIVMLLVCSLDCLLKINATEGKLPVKVDKNYEVMLYGLSNALTVATGSSVGYMQLKFNVINFGVMRNAVDRRGGQIYAFLCAVTFFYRIGHFNYLPRFFLSTLLFFAGAGFVAENLWGSRKYLSFKEWTHIIAILAVFILLKSLLFAVMAGILLTAGDFLWRYAAISSIARDPVPGGQAMAMSHRHREELVHLSFEHIANSCLLVVRLRGFIFFASAQSATAKLRAQLESDHEQRPGRSFLKLRFVIMDCEQLDGMDASASKHFRKLANDARAEGVRLLWTHASPEFLQRLQAQEILRNVDDAFPIFNDALELVERFVLGYLRDLQEKWVKLHPSLLTLRDLEREQRGFEPFQRHLGDDMARGRHWDFCQKIRISKFDTVLWRPKQEGVGIFLIHSGRVGLFSELPTEKTWSHSVAPVAILETGSFINREFLSRNPTKHYAVALSDGWVLSWSNRNWHRMAREAPQLVAALQRSIMRQWETYEDRLGRGPSDYDQGGGYGHGFGADAEDSVPPQELRKRIGTLQLAEGLGRLGLYRSVALEESTLPPLPRLLAENIDHAFEMYCVDLGGGPVLPRDRIQQALMYAGAFRVQLVSSEALVGRPLYKAEFVLVANHAMMARLSKEQVATIHGIFGIVGAGAKPLEYSEIMSNFGEAFRPMIGEDGVEAAVAAFFNEHSESVQPFECEGVISRMVKKHEQDWRIICCLRELAGEKGFQLANGTGLLGTTLASHSHTPISVDEAEELLWCLDWRGTHNDEIGMDFADVIGGILLGLDCPQSEPCPSPPSVQNVQDQNFFEPEPETPENSLLKSPEPENMISKMKEYALNGNGQTPSTITIETGDVDEYDFYGDLEELARVENMFSSMRQEKPSAVAAQRMVLDVRDLFGDGSSLVASALAASEAVGGGRIAELFAVDEEQPEEEIEALCGVQATESSEKSKSKPMTFRARLHRLLDYPDSSDAANMLATFMGCMIVISIALLVVEPVVNRVASDKEQLEPMWFGVELYFTSLFTIEYVLRLSVANALGKQTVCQFLTTPSNVCDIVAVLPLYIEASLSSANSELRLFRVARLTRLVRFLRLARLMRLSKLVTRSPLAGPVSAVLTLIWGIYLKEAG